MDAEVVPSDLSTPDSTSFLNENQDGKTSIRQKADSSTYGKTRSLFPVYNDLKIAFKSQIAQHAIGSSDYQALNDIFNFSLDLILREGVRFSLLLPDQVLSGESAKLTANGSSTDQQTNGSVARTTRSAIKAAENAEDQESEEDKDKDDGEEDGEGENDGEGYGEGEEREEEEYEEDEYEAEALSGFQKIYADVQEQYGESFYILTQNGPLFTSLNGRSSLDPRDYQIPNMFNTTRSLPHTGPATAYQMSYISPKVSAVPHPAIPPTEFMTGFVHPNGVPLPLPEWLNYGVYQSFAPTVDQTNAVLDETVVNSIWYEKYTRRKMQSAEAIQELLAKRVEETKVTENGVKDVEMTTEEPAAKEEEKEEVKVEEKTETESGNVDTEMAEPEKEVTEEPKDVEEEEEEEEEEEKSETLQVTPLQDFESEDLDFLSTLTWAPDHFVDEDEVEAARTNTEQELISKLLLELQNMQRVRLARSDSTAFIISPAERRLATKIQNMLIRVMAETTPKEMGIQPSPKYPVLQATYQGVLQVPDMKQSNQAASSMRPSRYMTRKLRRMM